LKPFTIFKTEKEDLGEFSKLKVRIISSAIGLFLLIATVLISKETFAFAVFILSVIATREFYDAVSKAGYNPVKSIGYISCSIILLLGFKDQIGSIISLPDEFLSGQVVLLLVLFIPLILSLPMTVFFHEKYNIADIAMTITGIFYTVFMFMFLYLTRELNDGTYYIWIIFIGAWATDTFAYFGGLTIGKKKINHVIRPNKTVEGAITGVLGCVVSLVLYGFLAKENLGHIPLFHFVIMGFLSGIISQIGDLTASAIKRFSKIKDYGNIIPGHGGVLDRFDSVLLISPIIFFYLYFILQLH